MQNLKPRQGTAFSLGIRGYKEGSTASLDIHIPELKPNNRKGLGNYSLRRVNAFQAPEIKPRFVDFEKLQALDLENQGIKVRLDDKSLEELLNIKIPDPNDTLWIAEDRRVRASYAGRMTSPQIEEVMIRNKPLGREQRTITSSRTVGSSLVKQDELLDAIKLEIQQGRASTAQEQKILALEVQNILNESKYNTTFTDKQFVELGKTLSALNVPKTHSQLGLPRYIDKKYYDSNPGLVSLLFLGNVITDPNYQKGIDFDHPIYKISKKNPSGLPGGMVSSVMTNMGDRGTARMFLDLEKRSTINYADILNEGKNPKFGGFNDPSNKVFGISRSSILKKDDPFGTAV